MSKQSRKAKLRELTLQHRKVLKDIRVIKATGNQVEMMLFGKQVNFTYKDGHLTRSVTDDDWLSDDEYTLLFSYAEMLMRAVFNGYKKPKKAAPEVEQQKPVQLRLL